MLIDSHCHIHDTDTYKFALSRVQKKTFEAEDYTPEKLLARAEENGIKKLICIGTSHKDSMNACAFAEKHDNVFWSYGIHPDESEIQQTGDPRRAILGWSENGVPPEEAFPKEKVL